MTFLENHPAFEIDPVEKSKVGRDPREMSVADLEASGHTKRPMLDAVRAHCLTCCGESQSEVRRCTAVACALWPYRMRNDPFRERRDLSDEQRAAAATRLASAREARRQATGGRA